MKKIFFFALLPALFLSSCRSSRNLSDEAPLVPEVDNNQYYYTQPATTVTSQPVVSTPVTSQDVRSEYATTLNASESALLRNYNVVVGAFKNRANAERVQQLMKSRGYNAFLVTNPQGLLRVIAGGYDTVEEARQVRNTLRANYKNDDPNTTPKAWILTPVR